MKKLKKTKSEKKIKSQKGLEYRELLIPFIIFSLSFVVRIVNLLALPLFCDEAIVMRWSQFLLNMPSKDLRLFMSTNGHLPFLTWLWAISLKFFSEPLFAGRIIGVVSGTLSTLGVYLICARLYSRKAAAVAAVLYIFVPETFFNDRMAYFDTLITMFGVYILLFSVLFFYGKKEKYPLFFLGLGINMGLAALTKLPAVLLFPFPLIIWFFFRDGFSWTKLAWIVPSFAFPAASYIWLSSYPAWSISVDMGRSFSYSFMELFSLPVHQWINNASSFWVNLLAYLTLPLMVIALYGIYRLKYMDKRDFSLFVCFLLPMAYFLFFCKGWIRFRYLMLAFPPLLIYLGPIVVELSEKIYSFVSDKMKWLKASQGRTLVLVILCIVLLLPSLRFDYYLLTDPFKAAFDPVDKEPYFQMWSSGYGFNQIVDFFKNEARKGVIVVIVAHPDIGVLSSGLITYLNNQSNILVGELDRSSFKYPSGLGGPRIPFNIIGRIRSYLKGNERVFTVSPAEWSNLFLKINPGASIKLTVHHPDTTAGVNIYELPYK